MSRRLLLTAVLSLAGASQTVAQGPRGPMNGQGARQNPPLAMTQLQTIAGPVTAVSIGYGMQYPSITVNKLQIKVAPIWYLLEKDFEIQVGDNLSIVAAPSTLASDPYLHAVEITDVATKARIVLRDLDGVPLWSRRGPGSGSGSGNGSGPMGNCLCEVLSTGTESGIVEQVTAGAGIQMPTLTLKTAAGKLLVVKIGPERILLNSDLELKAGDTVTLRFAVMSHDNEMVALAITKGSVTVTLRGDDGRPIWN